MYAPHRMESAWPSPALPMPWEYGDYPLGVTEGKKQMYVRFPIYLEVLKFELSFRSPVFREHGVLISWKDPSSRKT